MSVLYLIRHGQASLHGKDYDVLSELGHTQSQALGRSLAVHEPFGGGATAGLDRVIHGPLNRQRDTATRLTESYISSGAQAPIVEQHEGFREYPAFEIFAHVFPTLVETDPDFAAIAGQTETPHKSLRVFAALIERWVNGDCDLEGTTLEEYPAFAARVEAAFADLHQRYPNEKIAVVTSGGPIGVLIGHVLSLAPTSRMALCWRIANASVSRVERVPHDAQGFVLSGMNDVSHLTPKERTWV